MYLRTTTLSYILVDRIDKMWRFIQGIESRSDNEDEMTEEEIAALEKRTNEIELLLHSRLLQLLIRCH